MRWLDAGDLPDELVALIDSLGPGEQLAVVRDGLPIASITKARGTSRPGTGDAGFRDRQPPAVEDVKVVVTAMKLSKSARSSLSEQLGPGYIVLDMHRAPRSADVLLIPPLSPQLIGSLSAMFPDAKVIISEIEDKELGVVYRGPVHRLLSAGADTYLPPSTIPHLARRLDQAVTQLNQIAAAGASAALTIEAPKDQDSPR
ncbi:hypothetical protein JNUCC0626_47055 [Lentzea sp. JNUCC 0626]|uniref:hypothetical protein n=1 Tax=Lentzea sp. JNUCC 0626 TaxID=3367513 RepID=UPI00374A850A